MKVMITAVCLFFSVCSAFSFSKELDLQIIKTGMLSKDILIESKAVNNNEDLARLWKQMGDKSILPSVDFEKELVIFIISQNKNAEMIEIKKIEKRPGNKVDIFYAVGENEKSLYSRTGVSQSSVSDC